MSRLADSDGLAAVIGGGVAGLTAAYILQRRWPVTLYESETRLGGHAHTHRVIDSVTGQALWMDTAFMVFNERRYPLLTRLFAELGVRSAPTDMSLSVSCDGCGVQYCSGSGLRTLPHRLGVAETDLHDELALFNQRARTLLGTDVPSTLTLRTFLKAGRFSDVFTQHVVFPLVSILWSCDAETAADYPVGTLLAFLSNHGMLIDGEATRWRTVTRGSQVYVERIAATLSELRCGLAVRSVRRLPTGVEVRDAADGVRVFDRVVIAVHPDQALILLADPTPQEKSVLGTMSYTANTALLHTDRALLPRRERDWSAWNHRQFSCAATSGRVVSYWLNRLQNLDTPTDYILTLGAVDTIDPALVIARMSYEHPMFTSASVHARAALPALSGPAVAFAGAYHGWGFHEDGCRAGVRAAEALGVSW